MKKKRPSHESSSRESSIIQSKINNCIINNLRVRREQHIKSAFMAFAEVLLKLLMPREVDVDVDVDVEGIQFCFFCYNSLEREKVSDSADTYLRFSLFSFHQSFFIQTIYRLLASNVLGSSDI